MELGTKQQRDKYGVEMGEWIGNLKFEGWRNLFQYHFENLDI